MKIKRRWLLKAVLALFPAYSLTGMAQSRAGGFDLETSFSALIDTYVPADDAPGAIDLGIDRKLLMQVSAHPDYLDKVTDAIKALHRTALKLTGRSFTSLPLGERSELLESVLSSRQDENTYMQLNNLRLKTMTRFYTSKAAFEMLDYHPPSQGGYPDYDIPPV